MHVTRADSSGARPLADDDVASVPDPPPRVVVRESAVRTTEARHDETLARFVAARTPAGDGIVYVGMNGAGRQCDAEARLLATRGSGPHVAISHGERDPELGADHLRLESGFVVDLGTPAGVEAFVEELALAPDVAAAISGVLLMAAAGSRDELAGLARVFAAGERGGAVPSRLVISGHSIGDGVYDGDGRLGWLQFADIFALARAMPRAAGAVHDVMLSACNSGHRAGESAFRVGIEAWGEAFPNLRTVWAYAGPTDGHSPTGTVALVHLAAWEAETRRHPEHLSPSRAIARENGGHAAGYERNVVVWERRRDPPAP